MNTSIKPKNIKIKLDFLGGLFVFNVIWGHFHFTKSNMLGEENQERGKCWI